jgi:hypothetical protein
MAVRRRHELSEEAQGRFLREVYAMAILAAASLSLVKLTNRLKKLLLFVERASPFPMWK